MLAEQMFIWFLKTTATSPGTTNPNYTLHVNGTAYCTTGWSGSDERWKKNIESLENSLGKVIHLHGVSYDWRIDEYPDQGFTEGRQIGLVAQDVEEIIPEIVHTNDDGYKSISYDKLAAVLVEAVKELKAENETLKEANKTLKKEIDKIKEVIGL